MFYMKIAHLGLIISFVSASSTLYAHDPIFGIGPHVLFKDGLETAAIIDSSKRGAVKQNSLAYEMTYGLTGDWALGLDIPYVLKENTKQSSGGQGDLALFTKYRFWRKDSLGLQESAAVFLKVITDTAQTGKTPVLNKGTTDSIVGLTYGYEGRKWYRWASARYRFNGSPAVGVKRGDKILIDFVGGIRPTPTGYLEPDTVWLIELNSEFGQHAQKSGVVLANSGGVEIFLAPGIFWTKRNFAIKAGVQLPLYQALNGNQQKSDYRLKTVFEWHF